jgi:hypothetical protein
MFDFRYAVEIRVSPARIWPVLLDVEHWPEWTTSVTRAQRMDIGPLTLGSRTRLWQPRLMSAVWCVTSLDHRTYNFTWASHAFGVKIIGRHQIVPVKGHSRVILTLSYTGLLGAILSRVYRDLTWDYLSREGNGLRKRCEFPPTAANPPAAVAQRTMTS